MRTQKKTLCPLWLKNLICIRQVRDMHVIHHSLIILMQLPGLASNPNYKAARADAIIAGGLTQLN